MPKVEMLAVGADVESFLRRDGRPYPCVGVFHGTKENPQKLPIGEGYAVQEDNVMVEYNIPPARTAKDLAYSIREIYNYLEHEVNGRVGATIYVAASMKFPQDALRSKQAQTFGCEPDFCAWTRTVNTVSKKSADSGLRTAGGHVHVSFSIDGSEKVEEHPAYVEIIEGIVKAQDLFLGVPSLFVDGDTERRKMYGKAGAFRPKPYGVEYRVLSPFWTTHPARARWVFDQTKRAVEAVSQGIQFNDALSKSIQKAINDRNLMIAKNLCRNFKLDVPQDGRF